jgi:hypothetical protein
MNPPYGTTRPLTLTLSREGRGDYAALRTTGGGLCVERGSNPRQPGPCPCCHFPCGRIKHRLH